MNFGEMEEATIKPHAVIDDQQIALKCEGRSRCQRHNAVGWGNDRRADAARNVDAAVG